MLRWFGQQRDNNNSITKRNNGLKRDLALKTYYSPINYTKSSDYSIL